MNEPTPHPGDAARPESHTENRPPSTDRRAADGFRWQALFQRSTDALFLLDRQRRLRFVNRSWESLTGLAATDVRLLSCKRQRPAAAGDAMPDVLAHVLCPPADVMRGAAGRARRRLPAGDGRGRRWWDVEFLPLRSGNQTVGFFGRILPVAEEMSGAAAPLPEKLVDLRERVIRRYDVSLLDSTVPAVRRLAEQVRLAAGISVPVFLTGEAGTGKETLARVIHYYSAAGERPLATLDCTRLPPAAIAELLFGESGPAPGRPGAFYLREPGQLPRDLQLRLCRVVAAAPAVRVLAGCRMAPAEEVRDGRLLAELYAAFPLVLEIPPLRERMADLSELVQRMLERASEGRGSRASGLSPEAREVVRDYRWPGNLRELYDALAAAQRHAHGPQVDIADLPAPLRLRHAAGPAPLPERPLPLDSLLEQAERRLIELALRRARGHRGKAAETLGIWRARLLRRIEALGLDEADEENAEA
jgi:transcriptional regulator with AAA-type ATPase domain